MAGKKKEEQPVEQSTVAVVAVAETAKATASPAVIRVEEYSLYDFCKTTQSLIQDGYEFDFESNDNFPISYGNMITAGMVKG